MKVLGVVGPSDAGKTTLVESLVDRLADRGAVATVKHLTHAPDVDTEGKDTARHRAAGADATFGITDEEGWFATGADRTFDETLDDLAPTYDYAILEGFSGARVPQVVLGGTDHAGREVAAAPDADRVEVDVVLSELAGLEPHVTLSTLVERAKTSPDSDSAGAIATFTGRVRARDGPNDPPTEYLEFERYDGVAETQMETISAELTNRDGVHEVLLHHRTGRVEAGEDIVFVVVLAGHREEAFRTVRDGIDRLKDEVALFKKEVTVEEEFWVHERG
jgi:molybdopterin synthase catalytic subunit